MPLQSQDVFFGTPGIPSICARSNKKLIIGEKEKVFKGLVNFKTGYPVGGFLRGAKILRQKCKGFEILREIRKGCEIFA